MTEKTITLTKKARSQKALAPLILTTLITALTGAAWPGMTLAADAQNFWETDIWQEPDRGFLFYGVESSQKEREPRRLSAIKTLPELKLEVQNRLEAAVMDPSDTHITAYLEANTFLLQKSMDFAQSWQQTQWSHPAYDFTVTHPNANFAQVTLKENKNRERKDALAEIKDDWALVFIVQEGCAFCDMMAPVAARLTEETGVSHLALFISTVKPAAWPEALPDNGTVKRLIQMTGNTVTQTPAVFMVRSDSQQAYLIASGALSVEELTQRVVITAQKDRDTRLTRPIDPMGPLGSLGSLGQWGLLSQPGQLDPIDRLHQNRRAPAF